MPNRTENSHKLSSVFHTQAANKQKEDEKEGKGEETERKTENHKEKEAVT